MAESLSADRSKIQLLDLIRLRGHFVNRGAILGGAIIVVTGLVALLVPAITDSDPFAVVAEPFLSPGTEGHLLGTDYLGRDTLTQILYGARISLLVGILAAAVSLLIGVLVGATAGYLGGRIDSLLMRVTEGFQVMPSFLVALVVVAMLGAGLEKVIIVIGILGWPPTARIIRAQFLALREREFVRALRSVGVPPTRIMLQEILPNALPPAIAVASLDVGRAILLEAGLSYLGLGDPNVMSWGTMLHEADQFLTQAWWLSVFPGFAIFLTVMAFSLLGDGLTDLLNPRLRLRR